MKFLIAGGAALLLSLAGSAQAFAADDCAVSGLNGKAVASASSIDTGTSDELYDVILVGSAPIGCRWGVQAEVSQAFASGANRTFAAGHIFTRNPNSYLAGITGGYLDGGATSLSYGAAEGEYYTDRFTITGLAGATNAPGALDAGLYGLSVSYYWTDNFKITVGDLHSFGEDLGSLRAEWQPNGSNFSLFADVSDQFGGPKYTAFKLGGKFHFGAGSKSLKDRNRRDDPEPMLGTFGAWYNLTAAQIGVLQNNGGLPTPINGVCPAGFAYVPSLSTTRCYL